MTLETTTTPETTGTRISDLNLSLRARKAMTRLGIETVEQLTETTSKELRECKNFGDVSYREVLEKLAKRGLTLKDRRP